MALFLYPFKLFSVSVTFPFILVHNLLNMPTGVVPVTQVQQDDLNALSDLDENDLGVKEIKQVCVLCKLLKLKSICRSHSRKHQCSDYSILLVKQWTLVR